MEIVGNNLSKVLYNLEVVKNHSPGYEAIKPLLLIPGGAVRGAAINAGHVAALTELGYGEVFHDVVGISSGAAVATYFMTGDLAQVWLGCRLVYERIPRYVHPGLINIGRIFDTPGIEMELRHSSYAPNLQSILESPNGLYFGVIVRKTGKFVFLDSRTDIFTKVRASMTIPWISRGKAIVDGTEYVDGGFYQFPLDEIVEKFKPTDILILSNKTGAQLGKQDAPEKMMNIYIKKYPQDVRMKIERSHNLSNLAKWANCGINIGLLLPPDTGIGELTRNSDLLRNTIAVARRDAKNQIADLLA